MNQNKKYIAIIIGLVLIGFGLLKPDVSKLLSPIQNKAVVVDVVVEAPGAKETKDACELVISSLKNGPNPKVDGLNLAALYSDIAKIIELKNNDEVIKSTDELSKVNRIAGALLQLNLKDKYENLSENCDKVIKSVIGDDSVPLDDDLRNKASIAFKNLAWACKEGSK